jgi:uncharacterized Zn finger protein
MAALGRTWWGQRFIAALEGFTDRGRLQRGRGYSGDSRILAFAIKDGLVSATVRGNVNPYYGVYCRLASQLDRAPFLLFELRGLSREQLRQALRATPLGKVVAPLGEDPSAPIEAAESFYTPHTAAPRPRTTGPFGTARSGYPARSIPRRRLPSLRSSSRRDGNSRPSGTGTRPSLR